METENSHFDFGPKEIERQEEDSFHNSLVKNSLLCHWILTWIYYSTFGVDSIIILCNTQVSLTKYGTSSMNNITKFQNYQGKNIGDMSDLALVSRFVLSVYQDNAMSLFWPLPCKRLER